MNNHSFLVTQLGARRHYAIPRMLHEAGMLESFYTDICAVKGWPRLLRALPSAIQPSSLRRLLGRVPHGVPMNKISQFASLGLGYAKARANAIGFDQIIGITLDCNKCFCEAILRKGFGKATAIYTFNYAGLELMKAAKQAGLKTVMEQTIAPKAIEVGILAEASKQYPEWAEAVPQGEALNSLIAREEEEWQYADLILCGSEFVREGIARRGGPVDKCRVVPFGVENHFQINHGFRKPGQLRVLTVGQVGLRKGSPIIWETAERVGEKARFRMVGSFAVPSDALKQKPANVELLGVVPRSEIGQHYRWADVFLLPSLCEGSALVTYEAMQANLPVLCTPNTGSVVVDGVSGKIVPPLAVDPVVATLNEWVDNPRSLEICREGAIKQIPQLGLDSYRQRLLCQLNAL